MSKKYMNPAGLEPLPLIVEWQIDKNPRSPSTKPLMREIFPLEKHKYFARCAYTSRLARYITHTLTHKRVKQRNGRDRREKAKFHLYSWAAAVDKSIYS